MDGPSLQLQETFRASIRQTLTSQRPILTHLNADTSWLLQIPYPPNTVRPLGRSRYNVLLDPWFVGPQSDVAAWFSTQWHAVDSSVKSMVELNGLLEEIEELAQGLTSHGEPNKYQPLKQGSKTPYIDVVAISHEFTDHCNKSTLLELDSKTPIYATKFAADLVKSWNYFEQVQEVSNFSGKNPDWRCSSEPPLPEWVGISRIVTQNDALYYHSAILITFDLRSPAGQFSPASPSVAEAIIYSPHGINANDLGKLPFADPPIGTLALLHGLHDIKLSIRQLNLGAHNGLQAQRMCRAKYWVSTHDEVKKAAGFIWPFLCRTVLTLQEALEEEKRLKGGISDDSELVDAREVIFVDLTSGESLLLL